MAIFLLAASVKLTMVDTSLIKEPNFDCLILQHPFLRFNQLDDTLSIELHIRAFPLQLLTFIKSKEGNEYESARVRYL